FPHYEPGPDHVVSAVSAPDAHAPDPLDLPSAPPGASHTPLVIRPHYVGSCTSTGLPRSRNASLLEHLMGDVHCGGGQIVVPRGTGRRPARLSRKTRSSQYRSNSFVASIV